MNFQTIQRRKLHHNKEFSSYNLNENATPAVPQQQAHSSSYSVDTISDAEGLKRAYSTSEGLYQHGDRLYIAGTKSLGDVKDDITKIPAWGDSRAIQRYQDAAKYLSDHPEIKEVSGHSLGGSVALQLQKDNKQIESSRTYGAPVLDFGSLVDKIRGKELPQRYANYGDPIAIMDQNARRNWSIKDILNPHSHKNISEKFKNSVVVNDKGDEFPEDRIKNYKDFNDIAPPGVVSNESVSQGIAPNTIAH